MPEQWRNRAPGAERQVNQSPRCARRAFTLRSYTLIVGYIERRAGDGRCASKR